MIGTERAALGSTTPTPASSERALQNALRAVAARVRVQRALDGAVSMALAGLGVAALGVCVLKTQGMGEARLWLVVAGSLPLLGLLLGACRPVAPLMLARLIDRALGSADLIASAWAFGRLEAGERTPFMRACVARAERETERVRPAAAMRITLPRALGPATALAVALALLARLELPRPVHAVRQLAHRPRLLASEDASAFRDELAKIVRVQSTDASVNDSARELNALIEALSEQKLERAAALAQLRGLERRIDAELRDSDQEALREALRQLGRSLGHDSLAQSVADALRDADAAKARAELERLAQELREQAQKTAALRELAQTLARSAAQKADADADKRLAQTRSELDRLLKRKSENPAERAERERLLHKKQRELEHLERERSERASAQRQLDGLKRELSSAAQSLRGQSTSDGAQHLQRGADELGKSEASQTSAEQRRQLREKVQQLRELISKQQAAQRAQGGAGQGKNGPQAGGAAQRLSLEGFARAANGQTPGRQGENGKPAGKLLLPGQGDGKSDTTLMLQGDEAQQAQSQGVALGKEGEQAPGQGGHPRDDADPSRLPSTRVDTRVRAEQGEGPARSEVIWEAGQRGFASRPYQRVHGEYERHAEAVLERDKIPGGYRFYVRRYFQLIRPREVHDE